jgi:energy-converting hydrogenase Eha subunit G
MQTSNLAFALFAGFSGLRIFSYLPQIHKVANDPNGASAISYATWSLWTGANLATALYAFANLGDLLLAGVSMVYAVCCATVIGLTMVKRNAGAERAD